MVDISPTDADTSKVVEDPSEAIRLIAGQKHLRHWNASSKVRGAAIVVTNNALYLAGTYFDRNENGIYTKNHGRVIVPIDQMISLDKSKRPINRSIKPIGLGLLLVGLVILVVGLLEGSVLGIVVALFIGAAWLMVPGGLMLAYAKSGGEALLEIQHSDGIVATAYDSFSPADIKGLHEALKKPSTL